MLEVMRDILQSRYLRSNVAHKQLARTSLNLHCFIQFPNSPDLPKHLTIDEPRSGSLFSAFIVV